MLQDFLYGIARGKNAVTSGEFASTAASAIVSRIGAQFNNDELSELKKLIK